MGLWRKRRRMPERAATATVIPPLCVEEEGEKLHVAVELPRATSAAELDFEVSGSEMEVEGHGYGLKLAFARPMDEDCVTASFDKASRVRKVAVGVAPC